MNAKKTGRSKVTSRPTKETTLGGRKRRVGRHPGGEDSEHSSGVDVRGGRGSSKRVKVSDQATVRPPE